MNAGLDYLLQVDGANLQMGSTEPVQGSIGRIFNFHPNGNPHEPGVSFTLIVELGANLPGPTIHVKATAKNAFGVGNFHGSRIGYAQQQLDKNGDYIRTSREIQGVQAL